MVCRLVVGVQRRVLLIVQCSDVRYPEAAKNACMDRDASPRDIVERFRPAIRAAKAHGSLALIQLTHAG